MKKLITLLFVVLLSLPISASSKTKIETVDGQPMRVGVLLDVSAEVGYQRGEQWMVRLRYGPTIVRTPMFVTLGMILTAKTDTRSTMGLQGEVMHSRSGLWGQVSLVFDQKRGDAYFSAGWSLVGYEYQMQNKSHVFKVKLPISMIYYGLTRSW